MAVVLGVVVVVGAAVEVDVVAASDPPLDEHDASAALTASNATATPVRVRRDADCLEPFLPIRTPYEVSGWYR